MARVGVRMYAESMYWDNFSTDGEQNMEMQMSQTGQEPDCIKALQTLLSFKCIPLWRLNGYLSEEVTYSQTLAMITPELQANQAGWRQEFHSPMHFHFPKAVISGHSV